jgi:cobalt/nickel transport system permease protein
VGGGHDGHRHLLFVHGESPVHALRPQCKLAATVLFVFAVVATPREAWWAFASYAGVLVVVAIVAHVPVRTIARRLRLEAPFVAFALFLPIIGRGPRTDVLGASLSVAGLWGAWNVVAKATLGVAATGLLGATTSVPELLVGLERLRVPRVFVAISASMIRYAEVITAEMDRMRIARQSRADDPRWLWQARAVAVSAGALFVRSYERGERVHLAMQARGFDGSLPLLDGHGATRRQWSLALALPALAAAVAATAWATVG